MSALWPLSPWPDDPSALPKRLNDFDCGKEPLTRFLRTTALFNQQAGVARTAYLHPPDDLDTVVGYYSLALAVIPAAELPPRVRRRLLPNPMQAVPLLARLAVDRRYLRQGFGARLLVVALAELVQVCDITGSPVIAVQPIDDEAAAFYAKYGFVRVEGAKHMFLRSSTATNLFESNP